MSKQEQKSKCPDVEFVSAYFDGELGPGSPEFRHIKECPVCRKKLESYQQIADTLKAELSAEVPNRLPERIITRIRKNNSLEQKSYWRFPFILKIAAMLILTATVLLLLLPGEENNIRDISPIPEFLNLPEDPGSHLTTLDLPGHKRIADNTGAIDLDHFSPASTNNNNEINFVTDDTGEKPAIISPEVKQVWVVKNLESGTKEFVKFAKKDDLRFTKDSNGDFSAKIKISKIQLVELVRKCQQAGFKLLSPTQPQPEQNIFNGNKDDIVDYQAIFTVR